MEQLELFPKKEKKKKIPVMGTRDEKSRIHYIRMDTQQSVDPFQYAHSLKAMDKNDPMGSPWVGFIWI